MLQENPTLSGQEDMFRSRLDQMIDLRHGLAQMAGMVDWEGLHADLGQYYCADNGRPGESIRLMAGLLLLKELKGLSDEELCAAWRENPYMQYFCGESFFQHRLPVEPPSLSIFRKRIGEAGMEVLLAETIRLGVKSGVIKEKDFQRVTVDTTVQEKAVKFPTDVRLCHKAREELVREAKAVGIELRQSYVRKSKHALFMANKYSAARQMKRAAGKRKEVRNYLGRVIQDMERCIEKDPSLNGVGAESLRKATQIYQQAGDPKTKDKIYSWHAPEVECIAKGKAHKKYEFGCKASFTSTQRGNFIVGAQALHGKPYDGHTLKGALNQTTKLTGVRPKEAHVDQGYKGHDVHPEETEVIRSRQKRGITPAKKKRQKRRNAIEPIIGHCKNDRKTGPRNWLQGTLGDQINAIAMAIGFNLRKILKKIFLYLFYNCRLEVIRTLLPIHTKQNRVFYA